MPQKSKFMPSHIQSSISRFNDRRGSPFFACKYSTFCHRASPGVPHEAPGVKIRGAWSYVDSGHVQNFLACNDACHSSLHLLLTHPSLRGRQPCLATSSSQSRPRIKLAKIALGGTSKKRGRHREHLPQEVKLFTRQDGD